MVKKPKSAKTKKKSDVAAKKRKKAIEVAVPKAAEHPVRTLRDEVDRLFENYERNLSLWPKTWPFDLEPIFEPFRRLEPIAFGKQFTADLVETDEEFRVNAELPGLAEEDVEVTYSEGMLTIKGEKEEEREEKEEDYHFSERRYGKFRRSFSLPQTVNADKVQAKMKNGVLTVVLPKLAEAKKEMKKISVSKA